MNPNKIEIYNRPISVSHKCGSMQIIGSIDIDNTVTWNENAKYCQYCGMVLPKKLRVRVENYEP